MDQDPLFALIRGQTQCAWATHADLNPATREDLDALASSEPPIADFRSPPAHSSRYRSILGQLRPDARSLHLSEYHGAAFSFPTEIAATPSDDLSLIDDERLVPTSLASWLPGELESGRSPVVALCRHFRPVAIAFCARRSATAAEAGVETLPEFRRRGFATRVVAHWARLLRHRGVEPLYSASWANAPSIALARRLGLTPYAANWNLIASNGSKSLLSDAG